MDRYLLFLKLLALVADDFDITNAKMRDYSDRISIEATSPDGDITIEVAITEAKEPNAAQ